MAGLPEQDGVCGEPGARDGMKAAQGTTIRDLLRAGGLPQLEVRMLLQHVLSVPRVWLITHDSDVVPAAQAERFRALCDQRREGLPMAYLVERREFMGHDFMVAPGVLIPRPDTELLVETAIAELGRQAAPMVLDLGTGSGAIAVSVALACPHARVLATDASGEALAVACKNAQGLGAAVAFRQGDWYGALSYDQGDVRPVFDLIVSNPPYIPAGDPHLARGDLRFEPPMALTDGADGLDALRVIIAEAPDWLRPGGALWVEHGWDQADAVRSLLRSGGFQEVESRRDLAGLERISGGRLGGLAPARAETLPAR